MYSTNNSIHPTGYPGVLFRRVGGVPYFLHCRYARIRPRFFACRPAALGRDFWSICCARVGPRRLLISFSDNEEAALARGRGEGKLV
jgi:hypothetical protein